MLNYRCTIAVYDVTESNNKSTEMTRHLKNLDNSVT